MAKYVVVNNGGTVHTENRPGVGFISIKPSEGYECHDYKNSKGEIVVTAEALAKSIVQDSGGALKVKVIEEPKPLDLKDQSEVSKANLFPKNPLVKLSGTSKINK